MGNEWTESNLESLCDDITVGYVGTMTTEYRSTGIPFFRSLNIETNRINENDIKYISPAFNEKIKKSMLHPGDLVIVRTGKPGTCAIVPDKYPVSNCSDLVVVRASTRIDRRFLCYYINSVAVNHVNAHLVGAVQQHFNVASARTIRVVHPPLPTQKAIAHILGTLDDKIELLRSMNETLEAMARALFKSWFIDFDPVRKKAEGQPTGLPPEIDALFPDSFEDSELGEIPKVWTVGILKDVVAQRIERAEASVETAQKPYLPIDCITSNCLFLSDKKDGSDAQTSLTSFYIGDIVFGAMRPYFHKVCIAPFDGTTRTTAFVLHPIETYSYSFAVLTLHSDSTIEYATTHSTGTTIPYASWKNSMDKMPMILPNKNILKSFDAMIRPMLDEIRTSHFHYEVLTKARDSLLPRLISGELELSDSMIKEILEPTK